MSTFHLNILTPFGSYLEQDVEFLEVRNEDSVLGILPRHTPIISTVKLGKMRIKINGRIFLYATTGGVLNVKKDGTVTLLLKTIERNDEIDILRAKESLERAQNRISTGDNVDIARAKAAIDRASNRLRIAEGKDE